MSGRIISRAENWETIYKAFQNINFTAFDYQSIKQSMIDYIKLYFPETFNDFIESSEFVALIELFAYLGEIIAYRVDMASHENFLPTAQRKQSILRLAKLISYNTSRNIPARGLVKLTSVITTEPIFDSRGINIANVKINWNDPSNVNWKEQFTLVINKVLKQPFGSVIPSDRVQVQDVVFELYQLNNVPLTYGVIPFSVTVSGDTYPMELVPTALNSDGPYEKRPELNAPMSIIYGSDGLGDGSSGTGFFVFSKQGSLNLETNSFDGITPNQTYTIGLNNINETDVWVNNVDSDTLNIVAGNESYVRNTRSGEWVPVDLAQAQNIIYNTNVVRNKYEIETLENDNVRIIFGDGEFASIPSGLFHFWVRTSANADLVIPQSSINNKESSVTYIDISGIVRTLSFSFSATTTFQNAAKTEDIEHIRRMAPSVYYTQDRMVNGRDYNTFMLQDQTILKIRSFNRTFAGESNYVDYVNFNDPSGAYDNVKIFGDDLALYLTNDVIQTPELNPTLKADVVIRNHVEPLLSNPNLFLNRSYVGGGDAARIRTFTSSEFVSIATVDYTQSTAYLYYGPHHDPLEPNGSQLMWRVEQIPEGSIVDTITGEPISLIHNSNHVTPWFIKIVKGSDMDPWVISYKSTKIVSESPTTRFWFSNDASVVNYDSLNPGNDVIVILKANMDKNRNGVLLENKNMIILGSTYVSTGSGPLTDIGLPNVHQFSVTYEDTDGDVIPNLPQDYNYIPLNDLINPELTGNIIDPNINQITTVNLPFPVLISDITIVAPGTITYVDDPLYPGVITKIEISNITVPVSSTYSVSLKEYVYVSRETVEDYWTISDVSSEVVYTYLHSAGVDPESRRYDRHSGRYPLNFMWMHRTPNHHLVDPAAMNIIDTYIVTRGYYISMRRWLDGYTTTQPIAPTPMDLKTSYSYLIDNKMISDSLILHPGKFKILFGNNAISELQAKFKIIKTQTSSLTDNQVKLLTIAAINDFFDISKWEFGETFYFTELAAVIHAALPVDIESVVLVPLYSKNHFGDLFQVHSREDELFIANVTINDIDIISAISRTSIRQHGV